MNGASLAGAFSSAARTRRSACARNPIRVLIMDEVDGYPFATGEGEPTMLARKRLQAYEAVGISKAILASTPASARTSRIWPAYLRSDQRKFFVPCPHC